MYVKSYILDAGPLRKVVELQIKCFYIRGIGGVFLMAYVTYRAKAFIRMLIYDFKELLAFGLSEKEADCTIRVSLSQDNTKEDIDALCAALKEALKTLVRIR